MTERASSTYQPRIDALPAGAASGFLSVVSIAIGAVIIRPISKLTYL